MKKLLIPLLTVAILSGCDELLGVKGMTQYNAGVEYLGSKNYSGAEQKFKLALKENPELAEAHLNLGLIYMETGWNEGAKQETEAALAIFERTNQTIVEGSTVEQSKAMAHNNLGAIASRIGDLTEAKSQYEMAVQLDPTNAQAQANLKSF